jgi:predicted transcriptional regulator
MSKDHPIPVTWYPLRFEDGYAETYRIDVSSRSGLPPLAQFKIIRRIIHEVRKHALLPHFWISVDSPGQWYLKELKRFFYDTWNCCVAILPVGKEPRREDFQIQVHTYNAVAFPPKFLIGQTPLRYSHKYAELRILQSLARTRLASAIELCSLSGYSLQHTRYLARQLAQKDLIRRKKNGKYDAWEITRKGIQDVYRSWKTMPGFPTKAVCSEQKSAGWRHCRVSRLWARTLETSWGTSVQIWESWSEVNLGGIYPDSIAWGTYNGHEVLFWLEVETGGHSRAQIQMKYKYRFDKVKRYTRTCGLPIIFAVLGRPWTIVSITAHLADIPGNVALVIHPWMELDNLPYPIFGERSPQDTVRFSNYHKDKKERRFFQPPDLTRLKRFIKLTELENQ